MPSAVTLSTLAQLHSPTAPIGNVTRINLAGGLEEFPRKIFDYADTLEVLDLSGNQLRHLPDDLPRLHKLRVLFCSNNQFDELPPILGACPQLEMVGFKSNHIRRATANALPAKLRWLILTDNALDTLPAEIGRCTHLQKLMLAGNRLRTIPAEIAACRRLELIRVAANRLEHFPEPLLTLPRLAWLAYAGNPFCAAAETQALTDDRTPSVPWNELELAEPMGEGASGTIYRARRRNGHATNPDIPDGDLAVKLFKGAVTSDGLPQCEMTACLAAGTHPNRIPALAKITGHPSGRDGLLMPLIDPTWRSLAGPPSLATCTRDVYPSNARYPLLTTVRIAHGIASLAAHLHARGISHGDLYAHNILHTSDGRALLGDFGAASFTPPCRATAQRLERVEVRAFGWLLEELLDHTDHSTHCLSSAGAAAPLNVLRELSAACTQDSVDVRPGFIEITKVLDALLGSG